jgi:hypothetical protein
VRLLSRRELRVIEVGVGLMSAVAAYVTTSICVALAMDHTGVAIWFAVLAGLLSVGLTVAAYGLLSHGTNWRPWRRYRIR